MGRRGRYGAARSASAKLGANCNPKRKQHAVLTKQQVHTSSFVSLAYDASRGEFELFLRRDAWVSQPCVSTVVMAVAPGSGNPRFCSFPAGSSRSAFHLRRIAHARTGGGGARFFLKIILRDYEPTVHRPLHHAWQALHADFNGAIRVLIRHDAVS